VLNPHGSWVDLLDRVDIDLLVILRFLIFQSLPRLEVVLKCECNTLTTWIDIDRLLCVLGLTREDILENREDLVAEAVRGLASRLPTYLTLKEVKKRWGHGQEGVFPVTQFEKIWGDMSTLPDVDCGYFVVPRLRGQQL